MTPRPPSPVRHQQLKQPLRFISVGVINTLVGLTIIYLSMAFLAFNYAAANALGYGCALTVSFFLNKSWTFNFQGPAASSAVKFVIVIAIAYGANLALVTGLIRGIDCNPYLAQLLGILPYTLLSYLGSKYFAFSTKSFFSS